MAKEGIATVWSNKLGISLSVSPTSKEIYHTSIRFGRKLKRCSQAQEENCWNRNRTPSLYVYEVHKNLSTHERKSSISEAIMLLKSSLQHLLIPHIANSFRNKKGLEVN